MRLDGKNAVVTGGSLGIGRAVAAALLRAGVSVVIAARDGRRAQRTADELAAPGSGASRDASVAAVAADVSSVESVEALAAEAIERLGHVDILVNNAGIAHSAPIARLEPEDWQRVLGVNATGTYLCTRAFLPPMVERGWGRVVNVASTAGLHGGKYISAYAASKHAVVGFTRSVAAETAGTGVTVNAVCPGYVDTNLTRESVERIVARTGRTESEARDLLAAGNASGRLLAPEEISEVVVGLCADEADDANGRIIVVDGTENRDADATGVPRGEVT